MPQIILVEQTAKELNLTLNACSETEGSKRWKTVATRHGPVASPRDRAFDLYSRSNQVRTIHVDSRSVQTCARIHSTESPRELANTILLAIRTDPRK